MAKKTKSKKKLFLIFPLTISVCLYAILLMLTGMLLGTLNAKIKIFQPEETFTIERMEETEFIEQEKIEDILPQTGQSDTWVDFENAHFSFSYPENLVVRELSSNMCQSETCTLRARNVTKIGDLYVSTFDSNLSLDFDYDRGLSDKDFKEPIKTVIDGREFYYIVSQGGTLERIVSDYKTIGDILWLKTDYRVADQGYYLSFDKGVFYSVVTEEELPSYEAVFKTFKF